MLSTTWLLLFFNLFFIIHCDRSDNLIVKTKSGKVRGVFQKTLVDFIAYRGIPYAEPPVGNLRFKAPQPIASWKGILEANNYGDSCLVVNQSQLFPSTRKKSENCLFLNVFKPVLPPCKVKTLLPVLFFIHGGGFTEGDGTDTWYGPDFFMKDEVILVTINYRLGPWGFANFEEKEYTGNMGLKDQQVALKWIHRNIKRFGGDPKQITVFGESAGGLSTHLHILSKESRKYINRAIPMSGTAFTNWGHFGPNNHIKLFKEIFGLNPNATGKDVLQFVLNAPVKLLLEKSPAIYMNDLSLVVMPFSTVIEDPKKAVNPFLTQRPQEIYKSIKETVPALFGITSAEALLLFNPSDRYSWLPAMKNCSNVGLPFNGLTLSPESPEYREAAKKVCNYYFGNRTLNETQENLDTYVRYVTDVNFAYPVYQAIKLHSPLAETHCYEDNVTLNLNAIKITRGITDWFGMSHMEDLLYIFNATLFTKQYADVFANPNDPINQKTIAALEFSRKAFTDYAKTGRLNNLRSAHAGGCDNCVAITNDGVKPMSGLRTETMKFWAGIHDSVKKDIVEPF